MRRRELLAAAGLVLSGAARADGHAAETQTFEVTVLGSGLAGLTAAAAALEAGARRVLILEKGPIIGGHSLYSSGSLAAVSPKRQQPQGIRDSVDSLVADSERVGGRIDAPLVRTLGERSEAALDWLEGCGVRFAPSVFQSMGGMRPRCVAAPGPNAGRTYVLAVNRRVRRLGGRVLLRHRANGLRRQGDGWLVDAEGPGGAVTVRSEAVIVATGGFTANIPLLRHYDARIPATVTTTANPRRLFFDGADGDGILLAEKAGAALRNMSVIQLLPYWGGRLLDYAGGELYINSRGRRFVDETAPWSEIAEAILGMPGQRMWVITDAKSRKGAGLGIKLTEGTVRKSGSVREMAEGMGIDPAVLIETLTDYNIAARSGFDAVTGKRVFTQTIDSPPYYWGEEKLYAHMTLGGIHTDAYARVIGRDGAPVPGLYAAGETAGGIFGMDRLGGLSMMSCLVFGRLAGRCAVHKI